LWPFRVGLKRIRNLLESTFSLKKPLCVFREADLAPGRDRSSIDDLRERNYNLPTSRSEPEKVFENQLSKCFTGIRIKQDDQYRQAVSLPMDEMFNIASKDAP
jgi:hypothetical protein